jgi:hypothetical protein
MDKGFGKADVNAHVELFYLWCGGVHQDQVKELHFSIAPDDREIMEWNVCLHCNHILPSLETTSTIPPLATDTANILHPHHQGGQEPKQTPTRAAQLNQGKGRKEDQGSEMASVESTPHAQRSVYQQWHPAKEISASYLHIINSDTTKMANKDLQNQMSELRFCNTGFAHGLAASIYMGNILWNNRTTPSNLSPFTV